MTIARGFEDSVIPEVGVSLRGVSVSLGLHWVAPSLLLVLLESLFCNLS